MYIIYLASSPSNKKYIGFTSRSLEIRIMEHFSQAKLGSCHVFHKALRKYGKKVEWEILEQFETENEALNKEKYYIKFYKTRDYDNNGYNSTDGGEGCNGFRPTLEQNKKNSERQKEKMKDPEFRKHAMKNLNTGVPWNKGKKIGSYSTKESEIKRKNSLKRNGTTAGKSKIPIDIINIKTNESLIFSSMSDGANQLNLHISAISKCLSGKQKFHKGYCFKYREGN